MPNPPKPVELKRKLGNPGKKRLSKVASVSVLPAAQGVPEPLRELGEAGFAMWARVWSGGRAWVSPSTDIELVQLLCESMDERIHLRGLVLAGGDWRDRVALRTVESDIRSMLSQLGFTPTDRTRLGLAEVKAQSVLESLRQKRG